MSNPDIPEKQTEQQETEPNRSKRVRSTRMPFDTSDLCRIPTATDDDPPYRNWWVGDER